MTTKLKEKTIEKTTYESSNQSISYREIYKYKEYCIKLEIKSDSYKVQCYAKASVLANSNWNVIYTIPYSEMKTRSELSYYPDYRNNASAAEKEFSQDINKLKQMMSDIF